MVLLNIIIGLLGLGIMVFVHELGHLLAAKAVGIEVEAFSLGWGRKIVGFERNGTDYRISIFPIGGYCKMKGEEVLRTAWEQGESSIPKEPGAFYSASPLKRIFVAIAGPSVNFAFAVLLLSVVSFAGYETATFQNRIVIQSDYPEVLGQSDDPLPAVVAGLQTGDRVTSIAGSSVETYRDVQQAVATAPGETLAVEIDRNGNRVTTSVVPTLDRDTGAGIIGIYPWIDPVIEMVEPGSPAEQAGLQAGDRIVAAAGEDIQNSLDFISAIDRNPTQLNVTVLRNDAQRTLAVIPTTSEDGSPRIGVAFETVTTRTQGLGFFAAIGRGAAEAANTLSMAVRSIGLLFKGVNLTSAVAGPVRITYMIGEVATEGFREGIGQGFTYVFNFLALLSVVLFFMNLLPIPALDGGQILLFVWEGITGRHLRPKAVYRYQLVGTILILAILVFAVFGDVLFLFRR